MILQICHCSHDIASHFKDKHTCLGMLCDCTKFRNRDVPLPPPVKAIKRIAPIDDDDGDPPPTPRMAHPPFCNCAVCVYGLGQP